MKKKRNFEISAEYDERFDERRQELGMTVTAYFEYLMDNEYKFSKGSEPKIVDNPKDKERIAQLELHIRELAEKHQAQSNEGLSDLQEQYQTLKTQYDELLFANEEVAELVSESEDLKNEHEALKEKYNNALSALESENIIALDPLNRKILEFVAEREGNARKQDWTVDDVINYFVHHRFERGDIYGGFKSVPDSQIRKMKQELETETETE